ncbi:hypothetical protein EPUS_01355 [Endocarpon pusillum Z07020]|uniref:Aflatoxin biosynthesis ketoreductase nor-1 n=1 Tax=Endocarpon pusillum (strain Z07020 / HMAS-L-300199) TaxID=1263415 RepID=U1I210_ENDPU|nr:uncharacterized protein EPUS_01355 [Endocarpon pusillum Z07020]ERF75989.1 hypothetical protein EPUS_01355 [Endocarpon pusillum Z07020]
MPPKTTSTPPKTTNTPSKTTNMPPSATNTPPSASTTSPKTTFLVTGGNRGIGKGFVEHYLSKPNYTVIAGVRNPNDATSKALFGLPKGPGSSIIVVKIDSASETDAASAIKKLQSAHGITALNVVVASAGISKVFPPVSEAKIPDVLEHFSVNVLGIIHLFQAVLPLLNNAKAPKFITMSTSAASLGDMEKRNFPNTPYGTSKAALNYITRKIHFENPKLTAFPLDPGWVQTDMGNDGAKALGFEKAEIPLGVSIDGMTKVIAAATREKTSGKFMFYNGTVEAW